MTEHSKAWIFCLSLAGIAGSNPFGGHGYLSVVTVEVSASGWSLVQRSPIACNVSKCDRETCTMRRPWPTRVCGAMEK